MAGCALLLGIGDLVIVNALQPQNLNNAILHLVCGIVVAAAVYFCGIKRLLKVVPYLLVLELLLLLICPVFAYNINGASSVNRVIRETYAISLPMARASS